MATISLEDKLEAYEAQLLKYEEVLRDRKSGVTPEYAIGYTIDGKYEVETARFVLLGIIVLVTDKVLVLRNVTKVHSTGPYDEFAKCNMEGVTDADNAPKDALYTVERTCITYAATRTSVPNE